jgi:hypothetical protein
MTDLVPLIALACSGTKRHDEGSLPAIQRYDGPLWRTFRAHRPARRLNIWVLSARFGFLPASTLIPDYDQEMTPSRAAGLLRYPSSDHHQFADAVRAAGRVLFAGGLLYRETMRRACPFQIPDLTETDGGGIGIHRAQLRAWLAARG